MRQIIFNTVMGIGYLMITTSLFVTADIRFITGYPIEGAVSLFLGVLMIVLIFTKMIQAKRLKQLREQRLELQKEAEFLRLQAIEIEKDELQNNLEILEKWSDAFKELNPSYINEYDHQVILNKLNECLKHKQIKEHDRGRIERILKRHNKAIIDLKDKQASELS